MSEKKCMTLEAQLTGPETQGKIVPLDYGIRINIRNASSVGFRSAEVAVKDEHANIARTAYFGRIEPNTTATRVQPMPGGIESAAYKIFPDVGQELFGLGVCDNCGEVNITIKD